MEGSESGQTAGEAGAAQLPEKRANIQKIYAKDVSFEAPGTPQVFTLEWAPQVSQDLANSTTQLSENVYEVSLRVTVTVKLGDKVAYLAEVNQTGIFDLVGYGPEELEKVLAIFCPTMLFPYARETISDLSSRGGFPQLVLQHVDFSLMYNHYLKQKAEAVVQAQAEVDDGAAAH